MLCVSAPLLGRNSLLVKPFFSNLKQSLLFSSRVRFFSLCFPSTQTGVSSYSSHPIYQRQSGLLYYQPLRSNHTMASQSSPQSVHSFTVKVIFYMGLLGFRLIDEIVSPHPLFDRIAIFCGSRKQNPPLIRAWNFRRKNFVRFFFYWSFSQHPNGEHSNPKVSLFRKTWGLNYLYSLEA